MNNQIDPPLPTLPTSFAGLTPHQIWIALAAFAVAVIVRLLKSDVVPPPLSEIPPKTRPVVALVLGQLSGVLAAAAIPGINVETALLGGLVSAALAIAGHDIIIERIRDGLEFFAEPPVPAATEDAARPVRSTVITPPPMPQSPSLPSADSGAILPPAEPPTKPTAEKEDTQ